MEKQANQKSPDPDSQSIKQRLTGPTCVLLYMIRRAADRLKPDFKE